MATNTYEMVRFHASDMILLAGNDLSYPTEPEACGHARK